MLKNIMWPTIFVTDQDRALKFYTEQLGLEKRFDNPNPEGRFLTVGIPDSPAQILLWQHTPTAVEPGAATAGVVFLESDDLKRDFEVLRDRGVTFDQPEPEEYAYGVRIEAVDPDGNRISLRQLRWPGPSDS